MATLVEKGDQAIARWIYPDRAGDSYTVTWTTLDDDSDDTGQSPQQAWLVTDNNRPAWIGCGACQVLSHHTSIFDARMPTFDVDRERINIFPVEDRYLFKQYFEQDAVFAELRPYYNEGDYRFEVPQDAFDGIQQVLHEHFFDPVVVDDPKQFCVVYPKYTDHPDVLFKASVLQQSQRDYHIFLMKDQLSMEQAVNNGAERLVDTGIDVQI